MWSLLTFKPVAGARTSAFDNIVASLLVVIFGFLFVTVSSRICGLIGTSANPVSRHDHRDADGDLRAVPGDGLDGARLRGARPHHRRRRLHRRRQRRRNLAGPEDGLPGRRDAVRQQWALFARRDGLGVRDRRHADADELRPLRVPAVQRALDLDKCGPSRACAARRCASRKSSTIRIRRPTGTRRTSLLNALGSRELPDGKYLYNPDTGRSRCSGSRASAATRRRRRRPG